MKLKGKQFDTILDIEGFDRGHFDLKERERERERERDFQWSFLKLYDHKHRISSQGMYFE